METACCKVISDVSGPIAKASVRQKIEALESEWLKLPQVDIPVVHRFSGGIYAREIIIPEDTLLTGKIYKDDHFDVMVYGDITVTSDDGKKRLTGFNIFQGKRGKKRAGYTHSETKWITFCASPEMDDEDYIDSLTSNTFLEHSKVEVDRDDFLLAIECLGFTEEEVRSQSENTDDYREIECSTTEVKASPIDGDGLFMKEAVCSCDIVMPARCGIYLTQAGRFTNHSKHPNAEMVKSGEDINLVALIAINRGDEVTIDYSCVINLQITERNKQCQV